MNDSSNEPLVKPVIVKYMESIKILNGKVDITWIEKHTFTSGDDVKTYTLNPRHKSDFRPHEDFTNALKVLRKFLIDINEFGDVKDFQRYTVTGVHFSGLDQNETSQVLITGIKKLKRNDKEFAVQTPLTSLFEKEDYFDCQLLDAACSKVVNEAWEFIKHKRAPEPQLSIAFGKDGELSGIKISKPKRKQAEEPDGLAE